MTELNYEAIGRCKVLAKEIESASVERNRAINELREQLRKTHGVRGEPHYDFDAAKAHASLEQIERLTQDLREKVDDFNHYAADAGERPVRFNPPRE
ncbi:hypothetical protein [Salinicola aestuarinus]|uniref:hypothetical protein n=1 Tax=Salinicola aestuarinus TaxID=1949082 RepID=UPI000DA21E96|nr:hypothetical protein [Salinicola aestuarinus]